MTYQEKLIMFMEEKAKSLRKQFGIKKSLYFKKADRMAILNWSDKDCKKIFKVLSYQINKSDIGVLWANTCVFCLKYLTYTSYIKGTKIIESTHTNCSICEYAESHGMCRRESSDFGVVDRHLRFTSLGSEFFSNMLGKILKKIEEKEKNEA